MLTTFGLGLRHGVDWDHIAAIADLTSTTGNRRRGMFLSLLYALGHAAIVIVLGIGAILFASTIPDALDDWMGYVVSLTLIGLGVFVLVDLGRHGRNFRLRSRWMLMIQGAMAGVRRVRQPTAPARVELADGSGYSPRLATGIGALHGIGVESPTQIAIFVASSAAVGSGAALVLLLTWVVGMLIANTLLAAAAGFGFLHADRNFVLYAALAVLVAAGSIAIGVMTLFGIGQLPELFG